MLKKANAYMAYAQSIKEKFAFYDFLFAQAHEPKIGGLNSECIFIFIVFCPKKSLIYCLSGQFHGQNFRRFFGQMTIIITYSEIKPHLNTYQLPKTRHKFI